MNPETIKQLSEIQTNLKAPKGQFNKFGNYKYRSCEDILTAVKLLLKGDEVIVVEDEVVLVGDRYYIKATAKFLCSHGCVSATAFARESLDKKGMDSAQITGSASSYARKYALNGLLAIDDTKDADTHDNRNQQPNVKKQCFDLVRKITNNGQDAEAIKEIKDTLNIPGNIGEFLDNNKSLNKVLEVLKDLDR